MTFVDEARIFVQAGDGGRGCESFFKDRGMRHPRPNGGDGGAGGSVILIADRGVQTLLDFKYRQHHKAKKGGNGSSKSKKGKTGEDAVLRVPVGTIIKDFDSKLIIKDLAEDQQSVVVARGGKPGIGNDEKRIPKPPGKGEERTLLLELKLIADVGLVGFPNAGKSTLVSNISKVKSKIANYPFTTKQPILGFVEGEDSSFVIADLPGIIEGAHQGKGLGHRFLKHAERTKILVHVIDMAGTEDRDPLEDYQQVCHELEQYSDLLMYKEKLVVANKMDLPKALANFKRFTRKYKDEVIQISSLKKEGLEELVDKIREVLCKENFQEK